MMDVLQTLGVECDQANRFSSHIMKISQKPTVPTIVEVYGTGNIISMANGSLRNLNISGLDAFDLRTNKQDGTPWDFSLKSDRIMAIEHIKTHKPSWVVGSPPCTAFSQLQALNYPKMSPDKAARMLRDGRRHLHFVISIYKMQLRGGRHFLHEHPAGATSWKDAQMEALLRQKGVGVVTSDQCMYGLMTRGKDGSIMHAKKPTKWASSSPQMLARLQTRCDKTHDHQHLMGGRAKDAAYYPPELITEILRGMRDTADAEYRDVSQSTDLDVESKKAGQLHDQPARSLVAAYRAADLSQSNAQRHIKFQYLNGKTVSLDLEQNFKDGYKDEYTTEMLPKEETKDAMYDELSYFCDKVFRGVSYDEAMKDPEGKVVGCRWVNPIRVMLNHRMRVVD